MTSALMALSQICNVESEMARCDAEGAEGDEATSSLPGGVAGSQRAHGRAIPVQVTRH